MTVFNIITAFPEVFPGPLSVSVMHRAIKRELVKFNVINLRDFLVSTRLDAAPYGGGAGMIMRADVLGYAMDSVLNSHVNTRKIYMSPSGKSFNHDIAVDLSKSEDITILCGRFEGVDNRVIEFYSFEKISIGNYVLFGGEVPAMVVVEAVSRLIPGVLGNPDSLFEESFSSSDDFLEYPHYTRPRTWKKIDVNPVLLSGNHSKIKSWRVSRSSKLDK